MRRGRYRAALRPNARRLPMYCDRRLCAHFLLLVLLRFFEFHGLVATDDVACACRVAVLDDLELDAALVAVEHLTVFDRFHCLSPFGGCV